MSDTVPSAVILSSLAQEGPSFIPSDAPTLAGAVHVSGGAYADQNAVALIIDFQSLLPDTMSAPAGTEFLAHGPTLSGYVALLPGDAPAVVAGSLHHIGVSGS